jgi:hypothetical protein
LSETRHTGGCLCGALRYELTGEPRGSGYCCCGDCRKASGSGFIPFMNFASSAVRISGPALQSIAQSIRGSEAVRNHCAKCGGLVFGGRVGEDDSYTIYAGSLDDPSFFKPTIAIFTRTRPAWVILPEGLKLYETMPG